MKVTNRDFCSIYKLYQEIISTPEIKQEKKLVGKTVWQIVETMITMKPAYNELTDKEEQLKYKLQCSLIQKEKLDPKEIKANLELSKDFEKEHAELFDKTEIEVEPYQMPLEVCADIEKHLKSEATTFALFAFCCAGA